MCEVTAVEGMVGKREREMKISEEEEDYKEVNSETHR